MFVIYYNILFGPDNLHLLDKSVVHPLSVGGLKIFDIIGNNVFLRNFDVFD